MLPGDAQRRTPALAAHTITWRGGVWQLVSKLKRQRPATGLLTGVGRATVDFHGDCSAVSRRACDAGRYLTHVRKAPCADSVRVRPTPAARQNRCESLISQPKQRQTVRAAAPGGSSRTHIIKAISAFSSPLQRKLRFSCRRDVQILHNARRRGVSRPLADVVAFCIEKAINSRH